MHSQTFGRPDINVFNADCLAVLRELPSNSVDSVVTDPPYAISAADALEALEQSDSDAVMAAGMLGMQSQNWNETATHSRGYIDNDPDLFEAWCRLWVSECLRVLKPGGHLVAFGGTPTWHRLACAIEKSGFVIRGSMAWLYATGFPKGVNVGAALDGSKSIGGSAARGVVAGAAGTTARRWDGWSTALKPGHEPMVLARKPLIGTVAANVTRYGTGALNIDGCRVGTDLEAGTDLAGRWPSDVFMDAAVASELDELANRPVSRFFWHAKPGADERVTVRGVAHPTVKPLSLIQEIVRLVTPPNGTVLDPFAGSGTTLAACIVEGFGCVAVEREADYLPLIEQRANRRLNPVQAVAASGEDLGLFAMFEDV